MSRGDKKKKKKGKKEKRTRQKQTVIDVYACLECRADGMGWDGMEYVDEMEGNAILEGLKSGLCLLVCLRDAACVLD